MHYVKPLFRGELCAFFFFTLCVCIMIELVSLVHYRIYIINGKTVHRIYKLMWRPERHHFDQLEPSIWWSTTYVVSFFFFVPMFKNDFNQNYCQMPLINLMAPLLTCVHHFVEHWTWEKFEFYLFLFSCSFQQSNHSLV